MPKLSWQKYLAYFKQLIFPRCCLLCRSYCMQDNINGSLSYLCFSCQKKIDFIKNHYCTCCGLNLDQDYSTTSTICDACIIHKNYYTKARTMFVYNEYSAPLLYKYKYGDATECAKIYAKWLYDKYKDDEILCDIDLVVPVPLAPRRLAWRMYNQALLLALHLCAFCNITLKRNLLRKIKNTKPQSNLTNRIDRLKNLKNSFSVSSQIDKKVILLVDDILTVGATANECSRVLLQNGAEEVRLLTLATTLL